MVSQRALQDLKKIWENTLGQSVSDEFAMEQATNLLTLFDAVYRPIKKGWVDEPEQKLQE